MIVYYSLHTESLWGGNGPNIIFPNRVNKNLCYAHGYADGYSDHGKGTCLCAGLSAGSGVLRKNYDSPVIFTDENTPCGHDSEHVGQYSKTDECNLY